MGAHCFLSDVAGRELENARHALDRLARRQFFADEKRKHEIVRGKLRFADKIPDRWGAA
jgi:hypothetical protein